MSQNKLTILRRSGSEAEGEKCDEHALHAVQLAQFVCNS